MLIEMIASHERKNNVKLDMQRDHGLQIPDDVVRKLNIPYGPDPKWNLLDVYYPAGTEKTLPVIVNVHGGGYFYGDKEANMFYTMDLSRRGFVVVNFNYHLSPKNKFPTQLSEIGMVMDWMMAYGSQYYMDTDCVYMTGDSAGAQMVFHYITLLSNPDYAKSFPFKVNREVSVCGASLSCGMYDLFQIKEKRLQLVLYAYGGMAYLKKSPLLDPLSYITKKVCPIFIMTFQNDFVRDLSCNLHEKLEQMKISHEFRLYRDENGLECGHVHNLHINTEVGKRSNDD